MRRLTYKCGGVAYGIHMPHDVMNTIASFAQRKRVSVPEIMDDLSRGSTISVTVEFGDGRAPISESICYI